MYRLQKFQSLFEFIILNITFILIASALLILHPLLIFISSAVAVLFIIFVYYYFSKKYFLIAWIIVLLTFLFPIRNIIYQSVRSERCWQAQTFEVVTKDNSGNFIFTPEYKECLKNISLRDWKRTLEKDVFINEPLHALQIFSFIMMGVICIAWMILESWIVMRDRKKLDLTKDKNTIHGVYLKSMLAAGSGIIVKLVFPYLTIISFSESYVARVAGVFIMLVGLLLRYYAVQTLGTFFRRAVMTHDSHKLIQSGPYQFLRHPAYTGALLGMVGFSLSLNNYGSFIITTLLGIYAFYGRIKVEEEVLSQRFGKEYLEFSKKTKRLIPFVW